LKKTQDPEIRENEHGIFFEKSSDLLFSVSNLLACIHKGDLYKKDIKEKEYLIK